VYIDTSLFNSFHCEYILQISAIFHLAFIYTFIDIKIVSPLQGLKLDNAKTNTKTKPKPNPYAQSEEKPSTCPMHTLPMNGSQTIVVVSELFTGNSFYGAKLKTNGLQAVQFRRMFWSEQSQSSQT